MANPTHILSVGADPTLMSSRTLLLRCAGYVVEEAYTVDKAISLVEADYIDVTVICHTIPKDEQKVLISVVRDKRRLMPVLCIRSHPYQTPSRACEAVDNDPEELLSRIKIATRPRRSSP